MLLDGFAQTISKKFLREPGAMGQDDVLFSKT